MGQFNNSETKSRRTHISIWANTSQAVNQFSQSLSTDPNGKKNPQQDIYMAAAEKVKASAKTQEEIDKYNQIQEKVKKGHQLSYTEIVAQITATDVAAKEYFGYSSETIAADIAINGRNLITCRYIFFFKNHLQYLH